MSVFKATPANITERLSLELVPNPSVMEPSDLQLQVCSGICEPCPQFNAKLPAFKDGESFITSRFKDMNVQKLAALMNQHNLCLRATMTNDTVQVARFDASDLQKGDREMTAKTPSGEGTFTLHTRSGGRLLSYLRFT
jgi:hypothetical protein